MGSSSEKRMASEFLNAFLQLSCNFFRMSARLKSHSRSNRDFNLARGCHAFASLLDLEKPVYTHGNDRDLQLVCENADPRAKRLHFACGGMSAFRKH
jgi:hypothetical protein